MDNRKSNVVIIFAKKPEIDKVKTRIAQETSVKFAYEFAKACFVDLINKISKSDYYNVIVAVDNLRDLRWFKKKFSLDGIVIKNKADHNKQEIQSNKFKLIFNNLLKKNKYKKAALIPMDIPFISEEDLISVFARLDQKNFVFGPEINGGVYLIGIKYPYNKIAVFKSVRWSTSNSFKDLIKNCGKENVFSLKLKNDLNMPQDIINLRDEIYHNCPVLYEFLVRNGYYLTTKNRYINFDNLSICIPVVSNLVQRKNKGKIEILVQTRHKPTIDPKNTGKLEIPSGLIKRYELVQNAAIRETKEETGIISKISNKQRVTNYTNQKNKDRIAVFNPFYCHQQLKGCRAYLSICFISNYAGGKLKENLRENRNPRWVTLNEIKKMVKNRPEKIFSLSLATIKEYLKYKNEL